MLFACKAKTCPGGADLHELSSPVRSRGWLCFVYDFLGDKNNRRCSSPAWKGIVKAIGKTTPGSYCRWKDDMTKKYKDALFSWSYWLIYWHPVCYSLHINYRIINFMATGTCITGKMCYSIYLEEYGLRGGLFFPYSLNKKKSLLYNIISIML